MKSHRLDTKKIFCTLILPLFIAACGGSGSNGNTDPTSPNGPDSGGKLQALQVSRYTTTSLDTATVDAILNSATRILQTKDGPEDVVCQIVLARRGNVTAFTTGDGIVNSEEDYKALIALPGHIKVVNQINWCGAFKPNVIGCAPTPGGSFIAVRYNPSQEGILWNHEFGHNKGRTHRNEINAIMNEIIDPSHRWINETECNALLQ